MKLVVRLDAANPQSSRAPSTSGSVVSSAHHHQNQLNSRAILNHSNGASVRSNSPAGSPLPPGSLVPSPGPIRPRNSPSYQLLVPPPTGPPSRSQTPTTTTPLKTSIVIGGGTEQDGYYSDPEHNQMKQPSSKQQQKAVNYKVFSKGQSSRQLDAHFVSDHIRNIMDPHYRDVGRPSGGLLVDGPMVTATPHDKRAIQANRTRDNILNKNTLTALDSSMRQRLSSLNHQADRVSDDLAKLKQQQQQRYNNNSRQNRSDLDSIGQADQVLKSRLVNFMSNEDNYSNNNNNNMNNDDVMFYKQLEQLAALHQSRQIVRENTMQAAAAAQAMSGNVADIDASYINVSSMNTAPNTTTTANNNSNVTGTPWRVMPSWVTRQGLTAKQQQLLEKAQQQLTPILKKQPHYGSLNKLPSSTSFTSTYHHHQQQQQQDNNDPIIVTDDRNIDDDDDDNDTLLSAERPSFTKETFRRKPSLIKRSTYNSNSNLSNRSKRVSWSERVDAIPIPLDRQNPDRPLRKPAGTNRQRRGAASRSVSPAPRLTFSSTSSSSTASSSRSDDGGGTTRLLVNSFDDDNAQLIDDGENEASRRLGFNKVAGVAVNNDYYYNNDDGDGYVDQSSMMMPHSSIIRQQQQRMRLQQQRHLKQLNKQQQQQPSAANTLSLMVPMQQQQQQQHQQATDYGTAMMFGALPPSDDAQLRSSRSLLRSALRLSTSHEDLAALRRWRSLEMLLQRRNLATHFAQLRHRAHVMQTAATTRPSNAPAITKISHQPQPQQQQKKPKQQQQRQMATKPPVYTSHNNNNNINQQPLFAINNSNMTMIPAHVLMPSSMHQLQQQQQAIGSLQSFKVTKDLHQNSGNEHQYHVTLGFRMPSPTPVGQPVVQVTPSSTGGGIRPSPLPTSSYHANNSQGGTLLGSSCIGGGLLTTAISSSASR